MRTRLLTVAMAILAVWTFGAAQQADKRTGPRRKAPATSGSLAGNQILQVENDWEDAFVKHDLAALENILGEDWTYSPSDGSFKTRSEFIEEFRLETTKIASISQQNVIVRVYGNTAVVTGDEVIKASDGGKDVSSHIRFTDVLVRRDDRWQAVVSHETKCSEPTTANSL